MKQLKAIFTTMPFEEKWIIGQNVRQVYQWIRELALDGTPAMNYRVMSYNMLAEEWNQTLKTPGQYAHKDERLLAIGEIFTRLKPELKYYHQVPVGIHWVEGLLDAFDEMRLLGIQSEDFPLQTFRQSEKAQDLRLLLQAYENWLKQERRIDAVAAYQNVLQAGQLNLDEKVKIIILDDGFKLMPMTKRFREFWENRGATVVEVEAEPQAEDKPEVLKAYGDLSEIHQIFEKVKAEGYGFDQVQIIATKPEQLTRIGMIASGEGIPYTASLGEAVFALPKARSWIFDCLDQIEKADFWKRIQDPKDLEEEVQEGIQALLKHYQAYEQRYGDSSFMREVFHQSLIRLRVKGQPRQPGKLFVTDLAGADTKQRKATFVLGLDHLDGQDGLTDGPILYDEERKNISESAVTIHDRKQEAAQKRKRDLDRLKGRVYYSYSCFDGVNFTEKFPSPVILNHYSTQACKNLPMAVYRVDAKDAINSNEWILAVNSLPEALASLYPKIEAGRRAREKRKQDVFNAYNGQVHWEGEADLKLAPSSVTKFEKLARSPYLYWIENVLEIGREPEPDEATVWLNALEKGTLLHAIFQAYYESILAVGQKPNRQRDEEALIAYAHQEIEKLASINPPALAIAKEVFVAEVEQTCRIFLSMEEEHLGADQPVKQEAEVSGQLALPDGNALALRGKVDRIDQTPDGAYCIYDYKTGKSKSYNLNQYFVHGTRLQHAVYSLLVEQEERDRKVLSSGYLFPTRRGGGKRIAYPEQGVENRKDVLQILSLLQQVYMQGSFACGVIPFANQDGLYPELTEQNPGKKDQETIFNSVEALQEVHAYE